jgi:hypothetical protein
MNLVSCGEEPRNQLQLAGAARVAFRHIVVKIYAANWEKTSIGIEIRKF